MGEYHHWAATSKVRVPSATFVNLQSEDGWTLKQVSVSVLGAAGTPQKDFLSTGNSTKLTEP